MLRSADLFIVVIIFGLNDRVIDGKNEIQYIKI